jgi:hypothetical protein
MTGIFIADNEADCILSNKKDKKKKSVWTKFMIWQKYA